jgi:hypothetical protein
MTTSKDSLLTGQIIYLAWANDRLYAEVIQIQPERGLGWLRPLVLVSLTDILFLSPTLMGETPTCLDPQGPDLIWPLRDISPALDTEVITVLASIHQTHQVLPDRSTQIEALQQFITRLWINSLSD